MIGLMFYYRISLTPQALWIIPITVVHDGVRERVRAGLLGHAGARARHRHGDAAAASAVDVRVARGVPAARRCRSAIARLYQFNPMVGIIENFRAALLGTPIDRHSLWISTVVAAVMLPLGVSVLQADRSDRRGRHLDAEPRLMQDLIFDKVSKQYLREARDRRRRGARIRGFASSTPLRRRKEQFWALRDVELRRRARRDGRHHRPQRRGQEHDPQAARRTSPRRPSGEITINGRLSALIEVGSGFHPELTGRENIYLNGAILGMRRAEIAEKLDSIVDFAGVSASSSTCRSSVLVGHVRAARLLDRRAPRPRHPAARRGAGGRRRGVPGEVPVAHRGAAQRRHHDRVHLARPRCGGAHLRPGDPHAAWRGLRDRDAARHHHRVPAADRALAHQHDEDGGRGRSRHDQLPDVPCAGRLPPRRVPQRRSARGPDRVRGARERSRTPCSRCSCGPAT